jgi:hypothetical protein
MIRAEFDVVILEAAHQTLHVIFHLRRSANRWSAIRIALAMIVSEGFPNASIPATACILEPHLYAL